MKFYRLSAFNNISDHALTHSYYETEEEAKIAKANLATEIDEAWKRNEGSKFEWDFPLNVYEEQFVDTKP